jgi:hypothetical protein
MKRKKNGEKSAGQNFMVAKKIWRDMKIGSDKLRSPGQSPFLFLNRAPGDVGKRPVAELDKLWSKSNWMFQAGEMPDANGGDLAVFPFMKRAIGDLGKAIAAEDPRVSAKRAREKMAPAVCKKRSGLACCVT